MLDRSLDPFSHRQNYISIDYLLINVTVVIGCALHIILTHAALH